MKELALPTYEAVVDRFVIPKDHDDMLRYLLANLDTLAVDTETYYNPLIKGVSRYIDGAPNNCPFCMTLTYDAGGGELVSLYIDEEHIPVYKPLLEDEKIAKILHNAKFDMHMLKNIGIDINGPIWDTMIMIHLIDEEHICRTPSGGYVKSKALKNLAYHYLGDDGHKYEDLVNEVRRVLASRKGCAKSKISYKDVAIASPAIMKDYACADTEFAYKLYQLFYKELIKQELLYAYDVDMKATKAVIEMERNGVKVDIEYYKALEAELTAEVAEIVAEIIGIIPIELNINSANDLVKGFAGLGVEWKWFTDKGEYRTDDKVLNTIISIYPETPPARLAELVLKYRENSKLVGTFISQVFQYVQWDGRVHSDFNVCPRDSSEGGTVTGRLSSSNLNYQNIPKDDKRIRKGIVPEEGFILYEQDFAAQEYRLLAHYAQDSAFSEILHQGLDIHTGTAAMMLGIPYEQAKEKKNRDYGKKINFSLVYALGNAAFASSLKFKIDEPMYKKAGMLMRKWGYVPWELPSVNVALARCESEEEVGLVAYYYSDEANEAIAKAKEAKDKYFEQFPQIKGFIKNCTDKAKQRGWVKTWTGRRRHFKKPKEEGYKAPNAVIQGGSSDITKTKLWELTAYLHGNGLKSRIINTVHDSILFEVRQSEMHILPELKRIMCDLPQFSVPMDVDAEMSEKSWGDMRKVEITE